MDDDFRVPDDDALRAGLSAVLRRPVRIVRREFNDYSRTFSSEIVTYAGSDLVETRVFCKYMFELSDEHRDHGSRGGVPYEAMVYDRVLRRMPLDTARFVGVYSPPGTNIAWLMLEYLDGGVDLNEATELGSWNRAASWIGRFHRLTRDAADLERLNRYDAAFYRGWPRRAWEFAAPVRSQFGWLKQVVEQFDAVVESLVAMPQTVIHGEYYPRNILVRGNCLYPVDWESAAIAVGEIDLATLSDGWNGDDVARMESCYAAARWPEGPPPNFARTLDESRLFLQIRWLGDDPNWTTADSAAWRFEELRSAGQRLGLLD